MPANMEEAQRWYEKSAAQDNVLPAQRLKLGALFD
jgi:TPR repeat protein